MSNGRYRAYPEYRDSGIEWVGGIPAGWSIKPLLAVADSVPVKNDDGKKTNVLSLSYGNIIRRNVDENVGLLPESFNTYQLVAAGDIILRLTDLQNDKRSLRVGRANESGIITSAYLKLSAKSESIESRYLYRLLHSYDTTKVFYGMGGGLRQSMKFDDMRRLDVLIPPLPEQTQIAAFLDHETAKIDRLIEKQQALISLLKEKRQAVISHAVTKGLNPAAPMMNSGIEWLGQIPAHWSFGPLKRFWDVVDCKHITVPFLESGYRIASVMEVRSFELDLTDAFRTSVDFYRLMIDGGRKPQKGDIIYCRNTANTGTSAYVDTDEEFAMGQDVVLIKSRARNGRYLNYILHGDSMAKQLDTLMVGSTFKRINVADIRMLSVPCPPTEEQNEIVKHIDDVAPRFDRLIENAERASDLLQERRTALISAAVTGKIDVRNRQPPIEPDPKNN